MTILRFSGVTKQYANGHVALSNVTFEINTGEMVFLTGHSGAGKSTLLRLIHLTERPSSGSVIFGQKNLRGVRRGLVALHRREVGVVFQEHHLLTDRSVYENVALPLILRGMRKSDIGKCVRATLNKVGLTDRIHALPIQLSMGEQQRVGIARAIVGDPKLLIADEPTGNLDPPLSAEIMNVFATLSARGTSVLIASHDLPLVKRMRLRVLVLNQGKLVDDIVPEELDHAS